MSTLFLEMFIVWHVFIVGGFIYESPLFTPSFFLSFFFIPAWVHFVFSQLCGSICFISTVHLKGGCFTNERFMQACWHLLLLCLNMFVIFPLWDSICSFVKTQSWNTGHRAFILFVFLFFFRTSLWKNNYFKIYLLLFLCWACLVACLQAPKSFVTLPMPLALLIQR